MKKDDISPMVALCFLIPVFLMFFRLNQNGNEISFNRFELQKTFEATRTFLLITIGSLTTNIFLATLILERLLGYKKQGSRLRSLRKEKINGKTIFLKILFCFFIAIFFWEQIDFYTTQNISVYGEFFSQTTLKYLNSFFSGSLLLSLIICFFCLLSVLLSVRSLFKPDKSLTKKSRFKDHLTLGSVGEKSNSFDKEDRPKWLAIPKKALNGNILVTGSIGSGKTQGTILNYVDQLFSQFSQKPSALVLDPKGGFIGKTVKILEKNNLTDKCVYLGDV